MYSLFRKTIRLLALGNWLNYQMIATSIEREMLTWIVNLEAMHWIRLMSALKWIPTRWKMNSFVEWPIFFFPVILFALESLKDGVRRWCTSQISSSDKLWISAGGEGGVFLCVRWVAVQRRAWQRTRNVHRPKYGLGCDLWHWLWPIQQGH